MCMYFIGFVLSVSSELCTKIIIFKCYLEVVLFLLNIKINKICYV